MAKKITQLPAAASAQLTDLKEIAQGGVSYKVTNQQDLTLFNANAQLASTTQVTGINTLIVNTANSQIDARQNVALGVPALTGVLELELMNSGGTEPLGTIQSTLSHTNAVVNVEYFLPLRTAGTYILADEEDLALKEDAADKNALNGYPGLSGFEIEFGATSGGGNVSFLTHSNTAPRTYTFPDKSMIVGEAINSVPVAGTSVSMAINTYYYSQSASLCTFTLPTTAAVNTIMRVVGVGAGGWKVAQNASQVIHLGNQTTTTGTGGSLASTNQWDAIELTCVVANTTWTVFPYIGNITVV